MQTTIINIKDFPLEFYREFKAICAKKGWTVKTGIINLITKFIEENK